MLYEHLKLEICNILIKVARRLTKSQKLQIVDGYRNGKSSASLAKQFCCSSNTITRTIKSILSSEDYLALKDFKSKELFSTLEASLDAIT